jgi:hypothetical protein
MIHDAALPSGFEPATVAAQQTDVSYVSARWTPQDLEVLALHLQSKGGRDLARISDQALLDAWCETVEAYRDPGSIERKALDPALAHLCQLSRPGLCAGLEAVLGGVSRSPAMALGAEVEAWRTAGEASPFLVIALASNLPAIAVQPLLPALLLRCPLILKSPTSEPLFAPAFVASLSHRLPELRKGIAAITWKGGEAALEAPLFRLADRILAYGDANTLADIESRAGSKVFGYGPKTSLAAISKQVEPAGIAAGLARDIALFDQRGCLSIQAIFTAGNPLPLAQGLAAALDGLAGEWPQGSIDPVAAAGVQQIRSEASLRGLHVADLPLTKGTVVIDPEIRFQPTPGLRTVRIHPMPDLESLPEILTEWSSQLQGAALAGKAAWQLKPRFEQLGFSHFAPPGELQSPDASWHNGGVHPITALTGYRST